MAVAATVSRAQELTGPQPPEAIVLDLHLSDMNCSEVVRAIGREWPNDRADNESQVASTLTTPEMSIRLLANGLRNNKEITSELCISDRTVELHVNSIPRKLRAGGCTEALKNAVQQGRIRI